MMVVIFILEDVIHGLYQLFIIIWHKVSLQVLLF